MPSAVASGPCACHGARVPAMMSVVVDRVMGLASLALLAAIAVLFYLHDPEFATLAVGLWAILACIVLAGAIEFSRRLRSLVRLKALLERFPAMALTDPACVEIVGSILRGPRALRVRLR